MNEIQVNAVIERSERPEWMLGSICWSCVWQEVRAPWQRGGCGELCSRLLRVAGLWDDNTRHMGPWGNMDLLIWRLPKWPCRKLLAWGDLPDCWQTRWPEIRCFLGKQWDFKARMSFAERDALARVRDKCLTELFHTLFSFFVNGPKKDQPWVLRY